MTKLDDSYLKATEFRYQYGDLFDQMLLTFNLNPIELIL